MILLGLESKAKKNIFLLVALMWQQIGAEEEPDLSSKWNRTGKITREDEGHSMTYTSK